MNQDEQVESNPVLPPEELLTPEQIKAISEASCSMLYRKMHVFVKSVIRGAGGNPRFALDLLDRLGAVPSGEFLESIRARGDKPEEPRFDKPQEPCSKVTQFKRSAKKA
jgi:hypothetical protein